MTEYRGGDHGEDDRAGPARVRLQLLPPQPFRLLHPLQPAFRHHILRQLQDSRQDDGRLQRGASVCANAHTRAAMGWDVLRW